MAVRKEVLPGLGVLTEARIPIQREIKLIRDNFVAAFLQSIDQTQSLHHIDLKRGITFASYYNENLFPGKRFIQMDFHPRPKDKVININPRVREYRIEDDFEDSIIHEYNQSSRFFRLALLESGETEIEASDGSNHVALKSYQDEETWSFVAKIRLLAETLESMDIDSSFLPGIPQPNY